MEIYLRLTELLAGIARPTILEIGAHWGQDSLEFRRLFPAAEIWMFEPDPRNIFRIKKSGIDKAATLIEAAIGDIDGETEFLLSSGAPPRDSAYFDPKAPPVPWSFSSSLKKPVKHLENVPWVKFDQRAKVKVMKLDTFYSQSGFASQTGSDGKPGRGIDFIWADVQGAEDQMIAGGQQALARTSYLYTEYANEELYEGQINLAEILKRLPGKWDVLADYGDDVLLRNATKLGGMGGGFESDVPAPKPRA